MSPEGLAVKCRCGLDLRGVSEETAITIFEAHVCDIEPGDPREVRWYEFVFSPLVVFFVAAAAVLTMIQLFPHGL